MPRDSVGQVQCKNEDAEEGVICLVSEVRKRMGFGSRKIRQEGYASLPLVTRVVR